MKKIAICGPSGVGKGFICNRIGSEFGFPILDTDRVVHDMYRLDVELISELEYLFGNGIVLDGAINRPALRDIVFSDKNALDLLNRTVHARVRKYTASWLEDMEKSGAAAAIVDVPQIIESGMASDFDLIIGVLADHDTRVKRICERDRISPIDAHKRISSQLSPEEYKTVCHYTVNNDGSSDAFESIREIFEEVNLI